MKRVMLSCVALLMLATVAVAQERPNSNSLRRDAGGASADFSQADPEAEYTSHRVTQTPEMWFYEQERRRWENPQASVQRRAAIRAAQRSDRIASSRWYGMSNSRPSANITPLFGTYSPTWASNSFDPNRWTTARDTANTTIIVR